MKTAPESPSAVLGEAIDPAFEALVLRCLEKEPDDRPRDGAALADEIEKLELAGWTVEDARAWWREHPTERAAANEGKSTGKTQLAVEVDGRR